jgi:two-component system invasion response regulator UvrY
MKIIIADDHAIVRKGFQQIVSTRPGWVGAEAGTPEDLFRALRQDSFDVLVLDVSLGLRSGIDLLTSIRSEFPALPILMFSMHPEEQYAIRSLRAGAHGYIQKDSAPEEILDAIAKVSSGARFITPALASQLAEEAVHGSKHPHARLSSREFEVFRLIAQGRTPMEIAEALHLSVKTVSTYRTRILEKTGFRKNADIISYAIRNSII